MRILLLTHAFNSLCQRLYVELAALGHELSVELDISDAVTTAAVELFRPDLVIAPYLKRAIPEAVWTRHVCLIVHPGIVGDRGASSLDWAITDGEREWGVTVLQANAEMDAGDIWAAETFPMRAARKSSLYRNEVTEAAVRAVLRALERLQGGHYRPQPLDYGSPEVRGRWRPPMKQAERAIDWRRDPTALVLCKLRAADGFPGVLDTVLGERAYLYNACEEDTLRGAPGEVIAQRDGAICRATVDGAVWITHLKRKNPPSAPLFQRGEPVTAEVGVPPFEKGGSGGISIKLPAATVLSERLAGVPEVPIALDAPAERRSYREIRYERTDDVGYLHFDFYNGAMSTAQCRRLLEAYRYARAQGTRVLVLMGGPDFWSNGMDLNVIEAAASPADESWHNINAIDDLAREVITTDDQLTVSALQGNAGAGGVFLALAADRVWARSGVVLSPHYKNMGNLYGSEYWTYLLPRRAGADGGRQVMQHRLPLGVGEAQRLGLIDAHFGADPEGFRAELKRQASALARSPELGRLLERKREQRLLDELQKPLDQYRAEELARMRLNFYGFDPSYHVARYNFVHRVPHSWTPLHLARHRARHRAGHRTGPQG